MTTTERIAELEREKTTHLEEIQRLKHRVIGLEETVAKHENVMHAASRCLRTGTFVEPSGLGNVYTTMKLTDKQLAKISDLAVKYFLGWKVKETKPNQRRFPAFEKALAKVVRN